MYFLFCCMRGGLLTKSCWNTGLFNNCLKKKITLTAALSIISISEIWYIVSVPAIKLNKHSVDLFDLISHTICCSNHSQYPQIWINPPLKIVPTNALFVVWMLLGTSEKPSLPVTTQYFIQCFMNQSIDRHSFTTQCTRKEKDQNRTLCPTNNSWSTLRIVSWPGVFFPTDSLFSTDPSTSRRSDWFQTRPFEFLGNALCNRRSMRQLYQDRSIYSHARSEELRHEYKDRKH